MNSTLKRILLPLGAGLVGMLLLMGVYLGIVSLAESPAHALDLFWDDRAFVIPIMLGFGTQVGLYTLLKKGLYMPMHAPSASLRACPELVEGAGPAGGGMSAVAMAACCAHHVADVLPLVGLTAAATFLANWKIPFMIVGLLTNIIGIVVMLRIIYKERRRATAPLASMETVA